MHSLTPFILVSVFVMSTMSAEDRRASGGTRPASEGQSVSPDSVVSMQHLGVGGSSGTPLASEGQSVSPDSVGSVQRVGERASRGMCSRLNVISVCFEIPAFIPCALHFDLIYVFCSSFKCRWEVSATMTQP